MKYSLTLVLFFIASSISSFAQSCYWQQKADYQMEVFMDVENHSYSGQQRLVYTNNSPDTLHKLFYHLYFNAFQPGSMMDVRSRTITDPDRRVGDRISQLTENQTGFIEVKDLRQEGRPIEFETVGTILEVFLPIPLLPQSQTTFDMGWIAQIPLQIRRSGRDNEEGIAYSMAQWYPKLCEYDEQGWHADPYVGREFYGVWGDFDVKINIDEKYVVAATGYIQNAQDVGHGYAAGKGKANKGLLSWHFNAPNVHDFVWAADPDYKHVTAQVPDGPLLRFFYQENETTKETWPQLTDYAIRTFEFASDHFGKYPYDVYSIIQGGDGGMEYPMATLLNGNGKLGSLVGTTVHEVMHSWYQMVLATNESRFAWMDEGFASYAGDIIMNELYPKADQNNPYQGAYRGYQFIVESGKEEALSTHADHFKTNQAYGIAAYSKGTIFLSQLAYIIGEDVLHKTLLRYFNEWKFKHPDAMDFMRIAEKESDLELDWYLDYFVNTTETIDYALSGIYAKGGKTFVTLEKIGNFPMPLDVQVKLTNGKLMNYYIPLQMMRGEKKEAKEGAYRIEEDWAWTNPSYQFVIDAGVNGIESITIDPSGRMADIDRENNTYFFNPGTEFMWRR